MLRNIRGQIAVAIKELGLVFDRWGANLTYNDIVSAKLSPHRTIVPFEGISQVLTPTTRMSYLASLNGRVETGDKTILGDNVVAMGQMGAIRIGSNCIICDCAVLSGTFSMTNVAGSLNIGNEVYVGEKCVLTSCTIDDGAHIGMGSTVEEGVVIHRRAIVEPNSFVGAGYVLEADCVYGGRQLTKLRAATEEDRKRVEKEKRDALEYCQLLEEQAFMKFT